MNQYTNIIGLAQTQVVSVVVVVLIKVGLVKNVKRQRVVVVKTFFLVKVIIVHVTTTNPKTSDV